jgi:hypothetical protein
MFLMYIFSFFLFSGSSTSQSDDGLLWHKGKVLLNSEKHYEGELNYNFNANVVLCRIDNKVLAFPAHEVKGFWFFDQQLNLNRFFVTQDFSKNKKRNRKAFLEVVLLGEIPIYRVANTKHMRHKVPTFEDFTYDAFIEDQYVPLKNFNKKIYPILLEDYKAEIKSFVKEQDIRPFELIDQIRLIGYYNSAIISEDQVSANLSMYNMSK